MARLCSPVTIVFSMFIFMPITVLFFSFGGDDHAGQLRITETIVRSFYDENGAFVPQKLTTGEVVGVLSVEDLKQSHPVWSEAFSKEEKFLILDGTQQLVLIDLLNLIPNDAVVGIVVCTKDTSYANSIVKLVLQLGISPDIPVRIFGVPKEIGSVPDPFMEGLGVKYYPAVVAVKGGYVVGSVDGLDLPSAVEDPQLLQGLVESIQRGGGSDDPKAKYLRDST